MHGCSIDITSACGLMLGTLSSTQPALGTTDLPKGWGVWGVGGAGFKLFQGLVSTGPLRCKPSIDQSAPALVPFGAWLLDREPYQSISGASIQLSPLTPTHGSPPPAYMHSLHVPTQYSFYQSTY